MSESTRYSFVARALHWLIAGLIISQYVLAELAENAEHSGNALIELALLANHKSLGMTILALALVRIVWRLLNHPAPLPSRIPLWQLRASSLAHWALYALLFALPTSGWLLSSAHGYSVGWFNLFAFPDLLAQSKPFADILEQVHEILGKLLLVLAIVHILAAIKHHIVDKDEVLQRMASRAGWFIFVFSAVIALLMLGRVKPSDQRVTAPPVVSVERSPAVLDQSLLSDLPVWQIDYAQSFIKFSGEQAGAPFKGQWQRWSAQIQFDSTQLNKSRFSVQIETASAFSNDEERDGYIIGPDFFDADVHAKAYFTAQEFSQVGQRFTTQAELTIKGLSKPIAFTFAVGASAGQIELIGSATIDRLAWNIGLGDWADPTWVGQNVRVAVRVIAQN